MHPRSPKDDRDRPESSERQEHDDGMDDEAVGGKPEDSVQRIGHLRMLRARGGHDMNLANPAPGCVP